LDAAGLINLRRLLHAWGARRFERIISVITFLATLGFAPHLEKGVFPGVAISLLVFLPAANGLHHQSGWCRKAYSLKGAQHAHCPLFRW
jgi:hypothetical protein